MRNPIEVCLQIMEIVPDDHKEIFKKLAYEFQYKAPEQENECWMELSCTCNNLLIADTWKKEMIEILTNRKL